jgi:hypothetical protein
MVELVKGHISAIRTVYWKNLLHLIRYKFDMVFWAVLPILWVIPVILQGRIYEFSFCSICGDG